MRLEEMGFKMDMEAAASVENCLMTNGLAKCTAKNSSTLNKYIFLNIVVLYFRYQKNCSKNYVNQKFFKNVQWPNFLCFGFVWYFVIKS